MADCDRCHDELLILYVDDDEGYRDFTKLYLERLGGVRVDTVASVDEALRSMCETPYHAIVSDYQMPVRDGVEFLKEVRASGNNIPFILFTGKGREEVVIEAFENGANFYLQKGGDPKSLFAELLHKVRQSVKLRGTQDALVRSEEVFHRLFNETPLGIIHYDGNGNILECNDTFVDIVGSSREAVLGINMLSDSDNAGIIDMVRTSLSEGLGRYEGDYISLTAGKATYVRAIFKGMQNVDGRYYAGIGLVEDLTPHITEENRLESLVEEYDTVIMGTQEALFLVGVDGSEFRYIRTNRCHQEMTGILLEDIRGKTPRDVVGDDIGGTICSNYQRCVDAGDTITYEEMLTLPAGKKVWKTTLTPVFKDNSIRYIVGASKDITDYWQMMEEIRESEESYRSLVENLNEIIYMLDERAIIRYVSPNIRQVAGYEPSDVLGRSFADFVHPLDRDVGTAQFNTVLLGTIGASEYRFILNDGSFKWVRTSSRPILEGEDVVGIQGVLYEISKQKAAEQALRDNELKYRTLFEDSRDAIWVTSHDGHVMEANTASFELLGYGPDEFIGMEARDLYADPSMRDEFIAHIGQQGYVKNFEVLLRRKDGTTVLCAFTSHLWEDDGGAIIGYRGIVRDITEQKKLESSLRNQSRLQNLLIDISSRFLDLPLDQIDREIACSLAQLAEISRADRVYVFSYDFDSELLTNTHEWCAKDIESFMSRLEGVPFTEIDSSLIEAHQKGESFAISDVSALPASSSLRQHLEMQNIKSIMTVPLMDGEECRGFIGLDSVREHHAYDVFEQRMLKIFAIMLVQVQNRHSMAQELHESERKFRTYISSAPEGVFVVGDDGRYILVNEAACAMTGYTEDELLQMHMQELASPNAPLGMFESFRELRTTDFVELEILLRRKDGSDMPVRLHVAVLSDSGYIGFFTDITERKRNEQALILANKKLSILSSLTRHDVNNSLSTLMGFVELAKAESKDEALGTYFEKMGRLVLAIRSQLSFAKAYQELGGMEPSWQRLGGLLDSLPLPRGAAVSGACEGVEIYADAMLLQVFASLKDNSRRHSNGSGRIEVGCTETPDGLLVTWADDGKGVPPNKKEKIFEQGYGDNTGLGLFLAREILAITNIAITETGEQGKGARFELLVPKGVYRITPT